MPMGITAEIYDGTDMDLNHYLERVARSMTDFIHMRDDGHDAPLVKRNFANSRYMDEAQEKLDKFLAASDDELRREWELDTAKVSNAKTDAIRKNKALEDRYNEMIAKVEAKEFPAGLEYAKEYALKYLHESMDFDVSDNPGSWYKTYDFDEWKQNRRAELTRVLASYTKSYFEDVERDRQFNEKIELWAELLGKDIV